ncbi:MAG: hypothetical protein Q8O92_12435 [Candidatus Latescibacter sp.]|nr:hypothetical protein [Candidatus Latescibacter sp.]
MTQYSEEQLQEMISEAVDKTEKSFGGTFKRLKSENEELREKYESAMIQFENEKASYDSRMLDLDRELTEKKVKLSKMGVRSEIQRQLGEKGPIPERFINFDEIPYSEEPETLSAAVAEALEKGRKEFESALQEAGLTISQENRAAVNPTNPPSRDQRTARDLKAAGAKEALRDMARRGLIR